MERVTGILFIEKTAAARRDIALVNPREQFDELELDSTGEETNLISESRVNWDAVTSNIDHSARESSMLDIDRMVESAAEIDE